MKTRDANVPAVIGLALALATAAGSVHAQSNPLFESDETLELFIEAPFRTLIRNAEDRVEYEGKAEYVDAGGDPVSLDVRVRARGRSRLKYCAFPPLRLNFRRSQVPGTLFAGQNRLRLVGHCHPDARHARYVRQEYAIYKAYNLMTEQSFRVRWLTVHYVDSDRRGRTEIQPAFLIESRPELRSRAPLRRRSRN